MKLTYSEFYIFLDKWSDLQVDYYIVNKAKNPETLFTNKNITYYDNYYQMLDTFNEELLKMLRLRDIIGDNYYYSKLFYKNVKEYLLKNISIGELYDALQIIRRCVIDERNE